LTPEDKFKNRVVKPALKKIPKCWHFTKEAVAIRGISDIIGVVNGKMFAWELKKDIAEANKTTGRNVLQKHILGIINSCGGIGRVVYPENFDECLEELIQISKQ
jgi:uncharacterized membrane protein